MTLKESVLDEVEHLPEEYFDDVLRFIQSLKSAPSLGMETALVSQEVLGRDWLSEEEEEAWRDL